jgi:hypothetical protein
MSALRAYKKQLPTCNNKEQGGDENIKIEEPYSSIYSPFSIHHCHQLGRKKITPKWPPAYKVKIITGLLLYGIIQYHLTRFIQYHLILLIQ